jgi:imidazolonepropionase-like amidohydrolase
VRRLMLLATAAAAVALVAAISADAPGVYAIRGARIITVSSGTIDKGTVVIRHGIIDAVDASAAPPRDAVIIDGAGLTVYPGLIDLGAAGATESVPAPPLRNARTTAQVERWKRQQLLRPQVQAAELAKIDDADMIRLAAGGITTVLAVPPGEVIFGQSALVNVAAPAESAQVGGVAPSRRSLAVVKAPVALHVSFPARPSVGTNAYPASLMGVIAFVRQAFLDGQRYARETAQARPAAEDPVLAAMQPALERRLPVAFEANQARQILRALRFAREMNLDPIITGGREAGAVVDELKAADARVIVSLNFPTRSAALAADDDEPLRDLEARADAPKTGGDLARAGIRFAFASAGLTDARDFVRNAAKAVSARLPADAALRALTIDAAAIAGAADRLGSIEKGKIANLVVTDGDLFDAQVRIVRVFVGGVLVPTADASQSSSSAAHGSSDR